MVLRKPGEPIKAGQGVTPARETGEGVKSIIACWNRSIPRNKVRVLNDARYLELLNAMNMFTPPEIRDAIEFYSQQKWNRSKNAWLTLDRFLERIVYWCEQALEAKDRQEAATSSAGKDPRVRELQQQVTNKMQAMSQEQIDRNTFDHLPSAKRYELLNQARKELMETFGMKNPNDIRMKHHAIQIAKREGVIK